VNALAERLRTAAEKWARLDHAATWGPWSVHESWAGKCAVVTDGGHPIAVVSHGEPSDTAKADAELIAQARALAPVIASQLRQHAVMAADVVPSEAGRRWHITERCDYSLDPTEGQIGCDCFTDALALADAILGPVTA
jgi:hypothetical protein